METPKMNPEFKEEWCQALESEEYQQGKGALCENGKYCCLGVAEDLLVKKGIVKKEVRGIVTVFIDNQGSEAAYLLSKGAAEYMGLKVDNPEVLTTTLTSEPTFVTVASLNDNDVPFKEIAKLIREQL